VESGLNRQSRPFLNVGIVILRAELEWGLYPLIFGIRCRGLKTARDGCSVRPHFLQVDRGGDDLDVVETELRALGDCNAVRVPWGIRSGFEICVPMSPFTRR
jgi:hypothetical protein